MPDGDYGRFLREYGHVEMTPGDFVDREGRVLGRHKGLPCYTTGQRKGLGVSAGRHVYVVRKNAADNTILLGDNEELYARELTACRVNWISGTAPTEPVAVTAKTRYSQTEAEAEVTPPLPEGADAGGLPPAPAGHHLRTGCGALRRGYGAGRRRHRRSVKIFPDFREISVDKHRRMCYIYSCLSSLSIWRRSSVG